MLKPPFNPQYYKYCFQLLPQFTCKASEEQEVECDEPLMRLENYQSHIRNAPPISNDWSKSEVAA